MNRSSNPTPATLAALDGLLARDVADVAKWEQSAFEEDAAPFARSLVLYGAGTLGKRLLACLRSAHTEPLAFCDSSPGLWGKTVEGLAVLSPEAAASRFGREAAFIVTIHNGLHRFAETRDKLRSFGCDKIVPATKLIWKFHKTLLPTFWQDLPHKTYQHADLVRRGFGVWADDFSRREYFAQIAWRTLGDIEGLAAPVSGESYFPKDLISLVPDEHFFDGGAFDGCTIKSFLEQCRGQFGRITAAEPDPANYSKLSAWLQTLPAGVRGRIAAHRVAVGAKRATLRFNALGSVASALAADGCETVQCVPLDELLGDAPPTYIKLDVEGAEPDALRGATRLIQMHQPMLVACLYHQLDHLWSIPLLIRSLHEGYRLFLRPHECEGWQLVCYALPPTRFPQ